MALLPGNTTNGIFTRIGRIGGRINSILNSQGTVVLTAPSVSAGTAYSNLLVQFASGSNQSDIFDGYVSGTLTPSRLKQAECASLKTFAQNLLLRQVNDDTPLKVNSLGYAMQELIRQMGLSTFYNVTKATVAANTPVAALGNTGTAIFSSSATGPYLQGTQTGTGAMDMQFLFPETMLIKATADSYSGGATKYQETFTYQGGQSLVTDPLIWNFTTVFGATATNGSGCSGTINLCDAASYQAAGAGGNVLYNGDFLNFTVPNSPDHWTLVTGVVVTNFLDAGSGTGNKGGTTHSLQIVGDGATSACINQQFNNAAGTTYALLPNTVYAGNVWMKATAGDVPNITFSLVSGSGAGAAVINDNNGVANTFTQASGSITTSYVAYPFYFRTPAVIPSGGVWLRIQLSASLAAAHTINISDLSLRPAVQTYTGGPYIAGFTGGTAAVLGDDYTATFTNDFGNLTNKVGFQQLFNWLFDLRTMGAPPPISNTQPPAGTAGFMQLPVVGGTNIADSLVA